MSCTEPVKQILVAVILTCLVPGILGAEDTSLESAERPWRSLFDGQTLDGWTVTEFGGEGDVYVEDGRLMFEFGSPMTGVTFNGKDLPRSRYEIELEAQRIDGTDFFCGLTFPVNKSHLSLILGGWGGALVGLSSLDDMDASSNESRQSIAFRKKTWYRIRTRVTDDRVRVWIDDKLVIDQVTEGRKLSLRPEVELSAPLGICSFQTRAALRNIRIRSLPKASPRR